MSLFFSSFITRLFGSNFNGTDGDDHITRLIGGRTEGRGGDDTIVGGFFNDKIFGGAGDDLIRARTGHDLLDGGSGNDDLRAGRGNDSLIGGSGDDHLRGGSGADKFLFDPSNPDEGIDVIKDLDIADGDRIVLNAADVFRSTPGLTSADPFGDPGALDASDLDNDPAWTIGESADGFVVVGHPSGTIEIAGLPFDPALSFAALLPAIEVAGIQAGNDGNNRLRGGNDDDLLDGQGGDDRLIGRKGDDLLLGGEGEDRLYGGRGSDLLDGGDDDDRLSGGRGDDSLIGGSGDDNLHGGKGIDRFVFDPSNATEGADVIEDFTVGEDLLVLTAADIVRSTPDLLSALAGGDTSAIADPVAFLTALDNSADWDLIAAPSGNAQVVHPGGTIEFEGLPFDPALSFVGLAGAFDVPALNLQNGSAAAETLEGGRGDDLLNGEAGGDILIGGSGDDLLIGGADADVFRFDPSNGNEGDDTIADFNASEDKIQLSITDVLDSLEDPLAADGLQFSDLDASANWGLSSDGTDSVITHTGGTITLIGVDLSSVTSFADVAPVIDLV